MTTFIQPLDLQRILVNYLAGDMAIFTMIAYIAVVSIAAFFRMPSSLAMIMFALFGIMFAAYMPAVYFITLLLTGIAVFYSIGVISKR